MRINRKPKQPRNFLKSGWRALRFILFLDDNRKMHEEKGEILQVFGNRVQRCFGCFIAYHLKDMYLGEDASFFCENCKTGEMFHFSEFSKAVDSGKLREAAAAEGEEGHHH